jgi:hypothetical protein
MIISRSGGEQRMEGTIEFSIRPRADRVDYEIWSQGQPEEFFVALAIVSNYLEKIIEEKAEVSAEGLEKVISSRTFIESLREQCAEAIKAKANLFRTVDDEEELEGVEDYS